MRNHFKKLNAVSLCVMILLLIGCDSGVSGPTPPPPPDMHLDTDLTMPTRPDPAPDPVIAPTPAVPEARILQ
jgi:hypothetical protein